jgi:uncharacterized membrane protein
MIVSFIVTGKFSLALSIGFIELFTKLGLFYFHERIWNRIAYGRIEKIPPEYEI